MKIMKTCLFLLFSFTILMCLTCCKKRDDSTIALTNMGIHLEENGHIKQLPEYNSPYTLCYENKDGSYSLFIFAAPIQYKTDDNQYILIDNALVPADNAHYIYKNKSGQVKSYYPDVLENEFTVIYGDEKLSFKYCGENIDSFSKGQKINFTNMYGDIVEAVEYKGKDINLAFYSTLTGIKMEMSPQKAIEPENIKFSVNCPNTQYSNFKNGYITFHNNSENTAIIYTPLMKCDETIQPIKMNVMSIENTQRLIFPERIDAEIENCKVDMSFEFYVNKIPDSTAYEKNTVNSYLSNFCNIGSNDLISNGYHYTRFRLNYFFSTSPENILKATYYIKGLHQNAESQLGLYSVGNQWSSTGLNWMNKGSPDTFLSKNVVVGNGINSFDITDFVRSCFETGGREKESKGAVIMGDKNDFLATSDNSLYPPYVRIDLADEPAYFEEKMNINDGVI